jgi:23S rRNA-/tRNA-specific pseudouridylate synthase
MAKDSPNASQTPVLLHETSQWIVLGKPAGWHSVAPGRRRRGAVSVSSQGGTTDAPDVESWLRQQFAWAAGLPEAGLVHRLDQGTSGCLVAGRNESELLRLREAFRRDDGVSKAYLALVKPGLARHGEFALHFTSRHRGSKKVTVRRTGEPRNQGRGKWRVLQRCGDGDLVELHLLGPGRRHQLRAALAFLGHPIVGDVLYGGRSWQGGLALHAWRIVVDGEAVECPLPRHWQVAKEAIGATVDSQAEQ